MEKVFKNGPSKISGRQPLKNLKEYSLLEASLLGPYLNILSHLWVLKVSLHLAFSENRRFHVLSDIENDFLTLRRFLMKMSPQKLWSNLHL